MNYEQKYKEALERAKTFYKRWDSIEATDSELVLKEVKAIFPELAESEDDRIVKCLLNYFNHVRYNGLDLKGTDVDEVIAWLESQGNKSVNIDIEPIISSYKQRLKSQGSIENTPLFDMCLTAFRHGVENVLEELNLKTLDPDKVIEWLENKQPSVGVYDKFKKDFGL